LSLIILTDQERIRFAAYLEQEAATSDGLADQMDKLGGIGRLAEMYRTMAAAAQIIAKDLRGGEKTTIGGVA